MKKILAISLISFVLTSAFKDMVSLLSFRMNQDYIAQKFCINQSDPLVMCSGKCYFNQTIKKAHDKNENTKAPVFSEDRQTSQFLISDEKGIRDFIRPLFVNGALFFQKEIYNLLFIYDIFHPPQR